MLLISIENFVKNITLLPDLLGKTQKIKAFFSDMLYLVIFIDKSAKLLYNYVE